MVSFGAVKEKEFTLIEPGEYVLTLNDLEESEGKWGDRLVWKFLVAPMDAPTEYIARNDAGDEKTVWVFTDQDIILGSMCHELVEKLSGRTFKEGSEPPEVDDLIGKRVIGYIRHYTPQQGKNAGKKQEQVVAGSLKTFRLPGQKANGTAKAAPTQVSADPTSDEVDRALLVTDLKKHVDKLTRLNDARGQEAAAVLDQSDLDAAPLSDIQALLEQVKAAVAAELDS